MSTPTTDVPATAGDESPRRDAPPLPHGCARTFKDERPASSRALGDQVQGVVARLSYQCEGANAKAARA